MVRNIILLSISHFPFMDYCGKIDTIFPSTIFLNRIYCPAFSTRVITIGDKPAFWISSRSASITLSPFSTIFLYHSATTFRTNSRIIFLFIGTIRSQITKLFFKPLFNFRVILITFFAGPWINMMSFCLQLYVPTYLSSVIHPVHS